MLGNLFRLALRAIHLPLKGKASYRAAILMIAIM